MKLYLPEKFVNTVTYADYDPEGKRVHRSKRVESPTADISVAYSGPLGESYTEEALKNKKVLSISRGATVDFTPEEAKFLMERYPFVVEATTSSSEETAAPAVKDLIASEIGPKPTIDMSEAPTNFMQLKKWAVEKGVPVLPTDKKETILAKLEAAKS